MTPATGLHADRDRARKPSTAELESAIGRSRARIDLTLDALAQRLAPRRLLQRGMEMVSRFAGTRGRDRSGTERRLRLDPLALGLIGAGIAWLVAENAGRRRRRKPNGGTGAPVADIGAAPCGGEAQPSGEPAPGTIETHPLLLGLAGLALGAAVGAVLPSGRSEQEALARVREDLWQTAEALGHHAAARIRGARPCSTGTPAEPPSKE